MSPVSCHNENDIHLIFESGVPLFAKSFSKATAGTQIDTRRCKILIPVNKINFVPQSVQDCNLPVTKCLGSGILRIANVPRQLLLKPLPHELQQLLNIGKSCRRVIVVVHQPVVVIPVCRDLVNNEARLLESCASMLRLTAHLIRCHLQRTIEAEGLGSRWAISVIGAIPLRW